MTESSRSERDEHAHREGESSRQELLERWTEIILAVIMGAVALATAWSGYQSARWGGAQSVAFSQAGALRTESMRASTSAGQLVQLDIGMFTRWIEAWADDNEELATFYQERFRGEFAIAFEAWMALKPADNPDAPDSPFVMPEYKLSLADESDRLVREAEAAFAEGRDANQLSDEYILNAVILASVLFLSGIATRFDWMPVRVAIIVAALVLLTLGLYNLATYPVA
jgi:hypothetical protein